MKSNTKSGFAKHRQVVGTIAYSNCLCKVHLLHLCNKLQKFCLALSVNNLAYISTRKLTVVVNLKFVSINIIYAIFALQELAKVGKSTAKNSYLVSTTLKHSHQTVHSFGNRHLIGYLLKYT